MERTHIIKKPLRFMSSPPLFVSQQLYVSAAPASQAHRDLQRAQEAQAAQAACGHVPSTSASARGVAPISPNWLRARWWETSSSG